MSQIYTENVHLVTTRERGPQVDETWFTDEGGETGWCAVALRWPCLSYRRLTQLLHSNYYRHLGQDSDHSGLSKVRESRGEPELKDPV
jgi:hypothetical protein